MPTVIDITGGGGNVPTKISADGLRKLFRDKHRAEVKALKLAQEQKTAFADTMETVMVAAGAFGISAVMARWPERAEVMGVPISLVLGLIAVGAVAMDWISDPELISGTTGLGRGMLAAFAADMGRNMGEEARTGYAEAA